MPKSLHVAIIGGGMAGLAAACSLAERGIACTIFEAGSQLGGRARSVAVEFNGQVTQLDNGQHILLGAYHETLKLLAKVEMPVEQALMRLPLNLEVLHADGKRAFKLSTSGFLPYPFNQLFGFLNCQGLGLLERFSVLKLILNLKRTDYHLSIDEPLITQLEKRKQSARVIKLLWEPLCLSALNTPLHFASSKVFFKVLRDTFEGGKTNSDLLLPKLDLSRLLAQPMARYVQARQGQILLKHRVITLKQIENGYTLETTNGRFEASHVIIATPPVRFKSVIADLPKLRAVAKITETYVYQPIYTIYLQYARNVTLGKPMLGLTNTLSQWVFDRGILCEQKGLMAVIISAQGKHQNIEHAELASMVADELREAFPALKKPLWHQVIAEKRATFSCKTNLRRPASTTNYPNLFIAGDYNYADYPATIEGAVRSGINAANLIAN